jgi:hypothetical protein
MNSYELKLLSHEFRDVASRAANSHYDHVQISLKHLVDFVDDAPLLREAVDMAPRPVQSAKDAFTRLFNRPARRLEPLVNRREELGFLHDLLKHLVLMEKKDFDQVVLVYGHHQRFQDNVNDFIHDTVVPYTAHLRRVITAARLQYGEQDGSSRVEVNTSTGGLSQIVVHQGIGDIQSVNRTGFIGDLVT